MKMTIEVDCSPEEARRFLGLPDVSSLNDHLVGEMKKHGMTVTELTPAELARMRDKTRSVYDKFTPQIGAELMNQAKAEIAKAGK